MTISAIIEPQRRKSVFQEVGLHEIDEISPRRDRPQSVRFRSRDEIYVVDRYQHGELTWEGEEHAGEKHLSETQGQISPPNEVPFHPRSGSIMHYLGATILLFAAFVPFLPSASIFGHSSVMPVQGVNGGVIPEGARKEIDLLKRDDSPTDVCFRWAHQSAVINGTLYLYGGEATSQSGQTQNTWNNDFLTLDLTKTWQIGSPLLTGLPQPSGPPAVSEGYLWNSHDSLYLYGGEYSWQPVVSPAPFALWEYNIGSQSWIEHNNPTTSSGNSAPSNEDPVRNAAEGAGVSVPSLGRGFYFGGHLDGYTTSGWSQSVARVYLQSLLEFTYPGYANDQVNALANGQDAGSDGNYRNITQGGLQGDAGFTERADGLLVYVPGFGQQGILLALAGGTNTTFTQMNNVDVYDIANSTWYKQSTAGPVPGVRVNPCAVVAAAPDGSSYNIHMFGGQNLQPAFNQTQNNEMWILTLPSFTWIQVDQSDQSVPYGRSGHTCNIWDGQMISVGGYLGANPQLTCESPGIYVFNLSSLQWAQQFTSLSAGADSRSGSDPSGTSSASTSAESGFVSTGANNPFNQQPAQLANGSSIGGLEGSYGYQVPAAVISVIGGGPNGGATVTAPAATATAGPLATGKPITYTITSANGATVTETAAPGSGNGVSGVSGGNSSSGKQGPNIAAIVVGVICGILFIIVCYLAFCAYLYRRQLQLYKRHVEMSQRQARGEKLPAIPGLLATNSAKNSNDRRPGGSPFRAGESDSQTESYSGARSGYSTGQPSSSGRHIADGYQSVRRSSERSSTDDLLSGQEPTFMGVMLNPRRSLKVINHD